MNVSQLDQMSPTKRRLLSNFISLSVLQGANYVLPLITLPYLVRVLGPEKYGLVSFAQAFIQYFAILTDYGFNLSAVREIAINRDDSDKLSKIFSSVMSVKFVLLISSFIIMSIIVFSFEKFSEEWALYFLTFGSVLGQLMFPIWFFQGIERMRYITYLNLTARLLFTVLIFVFVRDVSDYIYVPVLNFLGALIAGLWALKIVFKDFKIHFKIPAAADFMHQLEEGWPVFISTIAISLYTTTNTFILGLFTNNTIVGYYSGAEKIIKAVTSLLNPVTQTIYPYITKLASESKSNAIKFIQQFVPIVAIVTFAISTTIFIFSNDIVILLLGKQYLASVVILKILAFLPCIIGVATQYATLFLLAFGYVKQWSRIIVTGSLFDIALTTILVGFFSMQSVGTSICWLLTETLILILSRQAYRRFSNAHR